MKLSTQWIRDFVDVPVDDRQLAEDLTAIGIAVEGIIGSGADTVFEMEIGTNRPDAMNHYGVAREAAAIYDTRLRPLSAALPPLAANARNGAPAGKGPAISDAGFPITVEEPEFCPRFSARVIRDTTIEQSPEKIAHRLQLIDQRPISNAVDATNYVLWEMGKPTHVFDMDLLEGGRLIIRKAKKGEKLKTLDGIERTLSSEDVVVADAKRPVGLAGVMGGWDTMITEKTRNVLIESAWWDPLMVRKTARRHGLHTDASHRFERGADFESTVLSCDLVAELIRTSGGGELAGDTLDLVSKKIDQAPVVLGLNEVHRILGKSLDAVEVYRTLKRLGFQLIPAGEGEAEFDVVIPSWRLDVQREIDLIEEIARLHGYDRFENTLPAFAGAVAELPNARMDKSFRERARALGYNEAVSLSFISPEDAEKFAAAPVLELENPLSAEASVMRTTLVPGMLDMVAWNLNRDVDDVRLFEMGRIYEVRDGARVELERACLAATASAVRGEIALEDVLDVTRLAKNPPKPQPSMAGAVSSAGSLNMRAPSGAVSEEFRAFKGDVENLLALFSHDELTLDRETPEYFHPGRSARVLMDGVPVAQFGQLDDVVKSKRKLKQDVYLAEFNLERLHARGLRQIVYRPLARFPGVERDFSFVFPEEVEFGAMERAVRELKIRELLEFRPIEIFRGGSVEAGKYSILLRARLQSLESTLRDEQISAWSVSIVDALKQLKGVQRS